MNVEKERQKAFIRAVRRQLWIEVILIHVLGVFCFWAILALARNS